MKKIQLFLLQFLLISITQHTNAQLPVKTEYIVEMGGTSGKGTYAPMWLTANRQGLSSANTENGYLRAGIAHTMPLNQHFGFSAGLDLATAYNFTSSFIIQQAYANLSYRWLNLSIGSKERLPELKNSKLSSGGMVESNNARPIPQIRLEVPDYVAIPGTHKWLHLKGHIAYGRFTDDKWQEHFTSIGNPYTIDVLYHSKSLFAKVGNKEHFPVEFEGGIQMSAQFGGDQYIAGQKEPVIDMPTRFVDFMRVLVPMAGDDTTPEGEQVNIYGNHVGSWNFAATAYLNRWKVKIYYEHYFDDHSQMFFQYGRWKDGHIGLEITFPKNRFIDTFVYEGLGTKDQTGPMLYDSFWGKFDVPTARLIPGIESVKNMRHILLGNQAGVIGKYGRYGCACAHYNPHLALRIPQHILKKIYKDTLCGVFIRQHEWQALRHIHMHHEVFAGKIIIKRGELCTEGPAQIHLLQIEAVFICI